MTLPGPSGSAGHNFMGLRLKIGSQSCWGFFANACFMLQHRQALVSKVHMMRGHMVRVAGKGLRGLACIWAAFYNARLRRLVLTRRSLVFLQFLANNRFVLQYWLLVLYSRRHLLSILAVVPCSFGLVVLYLAGRGVGVCCCAELRAGAGVFAGWSWSWSMEHDGRRQHHSWSWELRGLATS